MKNKVNILYILRGVGFVKFILVGIIREYIVKIGFFKLKICIGRGLNKKIFVSNYQYVVKLGVLFNVPWTKALWHCFTKWIPRVGKIYVDVKSHLKVDIYDIFLGILNNGKAPTRVSSEKVNVLSTFMMNWETRSI